jgi:uncharacterized protein (DUF2147 family)
MGLCKALLTAILLVGAVGISAAPAMAKNTVKPLSPVGSWEIDSGEARVKVSYCGGANRICLKLLWLREDVREPELVPYVGKEVMVGVKPAVTNKWRGEAEFAGETLRGTVTIVDKNTLTLNGCKGLFCRKFELHRY